MKGCQLRHGLIDPSLLKLIGAEEAERLKSIPLFRVRDELTVAMAEPQSLPTIDRLRRSRGARSARCSRSRRTIMEFVRKYGAGDVDVDEFLTSLKEQDVEVVEREQVDEGPSTDLDKHGRRAARSSTWSTSPFLTAVKDQASDIHIEPDKRGTRGSAIASTACCAT